MSELERIRDKLGFTLDQMAEAMGVAHSTIHRWESSPNTRSGRKALEDYKAFYKKRTKKDWEAQDAAAGGLAPFVTREEYGALLARLDAAERNLDEAKKALIGATGAIRQLALKSGSPEIEALLK